MATFNGTLIEFKRFIGPHLRNVVNQIAKKHKQTVGNCEHCGADGELHAAHIHGKDRIQIVESILGRSCQMESAEFKVDLCEFEAEFKKEHSPVEKAILVLCDACHRKYDSITDPVLPQAGYFPDNPPSPPRSDLLPITIDPPRISDFVEKLLRTKRAEIQTFFVDGRVTCRQWNANKFSRGSNLFGNLRSRPDFRRGEWQLQGIVKAHVRVVERPKHA